MASINSYREWSVRLSPLPMSIDFVTLAQELGLPRSRVFIPKLFSDNTTYAWINDFKDEDEANEFARQWSGARIQGQTIKCTVSSRPAEEKKDSRYQRRSQPSIVSNSNWHKSVSHAHETETASQHLLEYDSVWQEKTTSNSIGVTENFDRRRTDEYLQDRSSRQSSLTRRDSSSSTNSFFSSLSEQSVNTEALFCSDGIRCCHLDCNYKHPKGWNPCSDGENCVDYDCTANHPSNRKALCRDQHGCKSLECKLLHPKTRAKECTWGKHCALWSCSKLHPMTRPQLCHDGKNCLDLDCLCLHPSERTQLLCSLGVDCRDLYCTLNHPRERPSICDQPGTCPNYYCTHLHQPEWNPSGPSNECFGVKYVKHKTEAQRMAERQKANLPILSCRNEFYQRLQAEHVLVVTAETGSGKSTQLPQYAAEYFGSMVVCTQPRVVAALTLARRVAEEYDGKPVGESVGYQVGYGNRVQGTDIMYMTDNALIRESQRDPDLRQIRVLIIDEAHERSLNTDIVIGLAKLLLEKRPDDFYVVIASATIDPKRFLQFFNRHTNTILKVEGQLFPVTVTYKAPAKDCPEQKIIEKHIVPSLIDHYPRHSGHTLVFLPGQGEIERAINLFKSNLPSNCIALPLYGSQSPEEQEKVIKFNEVNKRMVVFCTNVAETSLTIPNIQLVVDSGLAKEARYDTKRRITVIETVRISRSSADQRKGRAGRTVSGHCLRLYEEVELKRQNMEPEILRSSLDLILLQLIRLDLDPKTFPFLDQPSSDVIKDSLDVLTTLQCIDERKVTKRGELFVELGLDPRLSAFIIDTYAEYRNLLELTVGIVAILSAPGSIFFMGGEKKDAKARIALQAHGHESDLFHLYAVYNEWKNARGMDIGGRCSQCSKLLRYCICRIKHSNAHCLNNKILQHIDSSCASIIKKVTNAYWLPSNDQIPANKLDVIGTQLARLFPEQHGYLLVPQLPSEGARLVSNDIRANITNTSTFMQKLNMNTDRELYQHFIAMNITQLPSGKYIIEKLHPVLKSDAPAQSSIGNLLTLENIGYELANLMRKQLETYRSELWAKWLVYHYEQVQCRFFLWGLEEKRSMMTVIVKRLCDEILNKLYGAYELFEYGPIQAAFQSGLVCNDIRRMNTSLRLDLRNTFCQTVNDLKTWMKRYTAIEWDEVDKFFFYNPKIETENKNNCDTNGNKHVCLFLKDENTFRRAMDNIPSKFMLDPENKYQTYRDNEKESWGRELVIQTPAHVTVDDVVNRYGAQLVTKYFQINKKQHTESFIKLNNLPSDVTEADLRRYLRDDHGPMPKCMRVGLTKNGVTGWAHFTFHNDKQRDQAATIYLSKLGQTEFPITIMGKRGLKLKFVRPNVMKNDDPNMKAKQSTRIPNNIFRITLINREEARRIYTSEINTTRLWGISSSNCFNTAEWTIDSSATVTIYRTDLYPDFEKTMDQICDKFHVKNTCKDLPNGGKRCTFSKGNPQNTSAAASLLAQTFAPITMKLYSDQQRQLLHELDDTGELKKWANELSLAIHINKYYTIIEIRGPRISQGQVMRRIADYSDHFNSRFRAIELNSTVAAFFGPQRSASGKLQEIATQWSSKSCCVSFNAKTATITIMGKPNVSATDIDNCESEILKILNEITADVDNDQDDEEEHDTFGLRTKRSERRCVFCQKQSSISTSFFRICGHAFCRCAAQTLAASRIFPLRCKTCKTNIHIRDIQIIFDNHEQLLLSLLKTSIQQYLTTNPHKDDRVFCPNDQCNGLIRLCHGYQTCLHCDHNVCPRCQVVNDEIHVGRTCAEVVEEKKCHPFLSKLFSAARTFVNENWPFDPQVRPIGSIDENPYLRKEYQSLIRFYQGNQILGNSSAPDLARGFFAYHGTSMDAIDSICQTGFDPTRRSGQVCGRGEYFGVTATISHSYCQKNSHKADFSRMIIAFILRCAQVTTRENFCYVVDNPEDWSYAFALPVLIVSYGPRASIQPYPFPLDIPYYLEKETWWIPPFGWYYQDETGHYEPYSDLMNELLEKVYEHWRLYDGPSEIETPLLTHYLDDASETYRISFPKNTQISMKTSRQTMISRRLVPESVNNRHWYYCNEPDTWIRYEQMIESQIERAFQLYRSNQGSITFKFQNPEFLEIYQINFLKGQQTNKSTYEMKKIKRQ